MMTGKPTNTATERDGADDGETGRLRRMQLTEDFDDDGISKRETILPTLILTPSPTSPTGLPSSNPSNPPTIFSESPSRGPTSSPSERPTTSQSPSQSPSVSLQPTLSRGPSHSPSQFPSKSPSMQPTKSPTTTPSVVPSAMPSGNPSSIPTSSAGPSNQPSLQPTSTPTVTSKPSSTPSQSSLPTKTLEPTNPPSESPTLQPTLSPSVIPTPLPPTGSPSNSPTILPSADPSLGPSSAPTMFPTLSVFPVLEPTITMELTGLPGRLSAVQKEEWENITSDHVLRFYQKFNEFDRGVLPVYVTNVSTAFQRQIYLPENEELQIVYEQTLVLGKFRKVNDNKDLFVAPFAEDPTDYVIDLLAKWDLDKLITLRSVVVGKKERPIDPGASSPPQESGISSGGLAALAASIVLGACAVVAFLFWDKKEKLGFHPARGLSRPTLARPASTIRDRARDSQAWLDNDEAQGWANGEQGRTRNPQEWPNGELRTPPRYDSNTMPTAATSDGPSTSGPIPLTLTSHHARLASRNNVAPISMRPGFFGRVRDESEITDSDGGNASDTGSDGYVIDPPTLPSIADVSETFLAGENNATLSPMHIPDDEDETPEIRYPSPRQEILGLARPQSSPSLLGFSMKIEDLE